METLTNLACKACVNHRIDSGIPYYRYLIALEKVRYFRANVIKMYTANRYYIRGTTLNRYYIYNMLGHFSIMYGRGLYHSAILYDQQMEPFAIQIRTPRYLIVVRRNVSIYEHGCTGPLLQINPKQSFEELLYAFRDGLEYK